MVEHVMLQIAPQPQPLAPSPLAESLQHYSCIILSLDRQTDRRWVPRPRRGGADVSWELPLFISRQLQRVKILREGRKANVANKALS